MRLLKVLAAIAVLGVSVFANTVTRSVNETFASVKFQIALYLVNHELKPEQQRFLLECISRGVDGPQLKRSMREMRRLFDPRQVHEIFNLPPDGNLDEFNSLFSLDAFEMKKVITAKDTQARIKLWKTNFAYMLASQALSRPQQRFVLKVSDYLSTVTNGPKRSDMDLLSRQAEALFSPEMRLPIFSAIGGASPKREGNCWCSVGSAYNACSTKCKERTQATWCTITDDGCGFLGWYSCDGTCMPCDEQALWTPVHPFFKNDSSFEINASLLGAKRQIESTD